jgi:F-type H+-transporting ATPase subunit g
MMMMKSTPRTTINQLQLIKRNSSNVSKNLNQFKDKFLEISQSNLKNQSKLIHQLQSKLPNLNSKLNTYLGCKSSFLLSFLFPIPQIHSHQNLICGRVLAYSQTVSYNLIFTKEVLKQVYLKENLTPPNLQEIKSAYTQFFRNSSSLNFWKTLVESGEWKRYGIYTLEAIGIFRFVNFLY